MVRNPLVKGEKPIRWVGSSKSDFLSFQPGRKGKAGKHGK